MPQRICIICNKIFYIKASYAKKGGGKYCSLQCRNIGYKTTLKGSNNPFYGKKHSKETLALISKAKKGAHPKTEFKKGENLREKHPNWKGGKYSHTKGYIFILARDHPFVNSQGYVLEHRLVVEKQIKRFLISKETVHHIGETNDNKPSMLIAFTSNSAHQRFHKNPENVNKSEIIFDGRHLSS